ncbi:CocE/NonD family hydrolase [Sphingomonas bacterium]|uniref:CocE/NonD family hydrolase n=1 Tax=Sphingomonas bacterium TaxID=1895847 RepID=UPI0015772756|nr:CocE/NonD family hydrolase [Sphingomonas bacterium]
MRIATLIGLGVLAVTSTGAGASVPQTTPPPPVIRSPFTFEEVMIPMRDGARLQTVILRPRDRPEKLPILLQRTPYGVPAAAPDGVTRFAPLMRDGYVFVFQSMRGRFKSDGAFTLSTAVHPSDPKAVDEATDAYDTIDWLVRHVPANNGRVGIWGVSYPGFAAGVALVHPHPALKAASPQAAWIDYWQSDDLHRNGALRLSYTADWVSELQVDKTQLKPFEYPTRDTYEYLLSLGSAGNLDSQVFKGSVPMLTSLIEHPNHDSFYTSQNWQKALGRTSVPTLNVAGFWDQEDPWGSWQIYAQQKKDDPQHLSQMVSGPWNHGGWQGKGDMLGPIPLRQESGTQFQEQIQAPFFRYWLHGKGERPDFAARMFQSGSNRWHDYASWPPAGARPTSLYLHADASLSFTAPATDEGCRHYVSDPANPVPFRARPISPTYPAPEWRWWEAADQRFVDHRPDVLSWTSAPLTADLTVTGTVAATIFASTSGTDSDVVVKLIDVLPDDTQGYDPATAKLGDYTRQLNGYQLPVAMDVRRGRFLASDTDPRPLVPGKVVAWDVPLRDHDHVFLKGHRIMVQVQSNWFPMIDRNPQSFVPNIAKAKPADYIVANQSVCFAPGRESRIVLPVMR